jgi:hypothetical protein
VRRVGWCTVPVDVQAAVEAQFRESLPWTAVPWLHRARGNSSPPTALQRTEECMESTEEPRGAMKCVHCGQKLVCGQPAMGGPPCLGQVHVHSNETACFPEQGPASPRARPDRDCGCKPRDLKPFIPDAPPPFPFGMEGPDGGTRRPSTKIEATARRPREPFQGSRGEPHRSRPPYGASTASGRSDGAVVRSERGR